MADEFEGGLALLVIGGGFVFKAVKDHRQKRKVQDTQRSKIATAPQGYVEFEGFAWPMTETVEINDGYQTLYYSLEVQQFVQSGKSSQWETVHTHLKADPFYVTDATGVVMVYPMEAEVNIESSKTEEWLDLNQDERTRILMKLEGTSISEFPPTESFLSIFSGKFRIVEKYIFVGSPLYIHGAFTGIGGEPENVEMPGYANFSESVFQGKELKNKSQIFDKNNDTNVSEEESRTGYVAIARIARSKKETQTVKFPVYGILKSNEQHQAMIADAHEKYFTERLEKWLWLKFAGGALAMAVGAFILAQSKW